MESLQQVLDAPSLLEGRPLVQGLAQGGLRDVAAFRQLGEGPFARLVITTVQIGQTARYVLGVEAEQRLQPLTQDGDGRPRGVRALAEGAVRICRTQPECLPERLRLEAVRLGYGRTRQG